MNTVRWMIVVMGLLLMTAVVMGQEENPPMPPHAVIVNNNPGVALRPITSANHEIRPYAVSMPDGWGDASMPPNGDLCWNRPQIVEAQKTYSFEDFIAEVDSERGLFESVEVVGASRLLGSWTYQVPVMEPTEVTLMYYTPETDT